MRSVLLSLALLLPLVAAGGFAYWVNREKLEGPTYQGKTVAEWEASLKCPVSIHGSGTIGYMIYDPPPLWRRAGVWLGLLKVEHNIEFVESPGELSCPEAVPILINLLRSRDVSVRQDAAAYLELIGGEARDAVPALIMAMADSNSEVRQNAIAALRKIDPDSAPPEE